MATSRRGKAIRAIDLGGGLMLLSVTVTRPRTPDDNAVLSRSEQEVVRLAARGLSNNAIAAQRSCSIHTIANQLSSAYRKLGVSGRRELRARLQQERRHK
jgi:DNA-binding CsgD family transcriptional regulator